MGNHSRKLTGSQKMCTVTENGLLSTFEALIFLELYYLVKDYESILIIKPYMQIFKYW